MLARGKSVPAASRWTLSRRPGMAPTSCSFATNAATSTPTHQGLFYDGGFCDGGILMVGGGGESERNVGIT